MIAAKNIFRTIAVSLGVAATVVILGCGDNSGLARRYPVTGTVKYKGEPLKVGQIAFEPANPPVGEGRHAEGHIENGNFTLTTANEGDGALPGEYKVLILASTLDVSTLLPKGGGPLHQGDEAHQKAIKAAKSAVPVKYSRSETSGLTAKVEAKSNHFEFNLTD